MYKTTQTMRMALKALLGSRLRTALTMLGMVIGVAAVILLTSLGNGVQGRVTGQIGSLGTDTVQINPGSEENDGPFGSVVSSTLTVADARRVGALPSVAAVSPSVSVVAQANGAPLSLSGVDPAYAQIRTVDLDAGRFLARRGDLVLTADTARELLNAAPGAAIGKTVQIKGAPYTVVGVAKAAAGGFGPPIQSTSYVATADALTLADATTVGQILVRARDSASVDTAVSEIRTALTASHGGTADFYVETQADLLSTFTLISDLLTYLLAGIAGISLLVGGIGIMNIMLVSVTERTREIGVRKAFGATSWDVLLQFFLEAILLAVIGGLAGIALGAGVAALLPQISANLPTETTSTAVGLAFGVSVLIGVVFGVLPAIRSARQQPVEALRRE